MTVAEKFLTMRLIKLINEYPEYTKSIGIELDDNAESDNEEFYVDSE